ncbi:MAG TPA: glycosyltransferase 87 family protein [Candidatus Limnocylindrales bacterium]|nr:glycosyltransferase 87 family protein [Candidatus Limnocylindrales bacterium]
MSGLTERVAGRLGMDRRLLLGLLGLAVVAFVARLVPVLASAGLHGFIDYDDGVYMGSALALVRGRIVYRDFVMLHPPGMVYVLSPFALLSFAVSDANAFAAARLGMMALGAVSTFLVGAVAARLSRAAAIAAAALYAVWIVPIYVERSTWLVGPQNTALLLALLVLAGPRSTAQPGDGEPEAAPRLGWRRCGLAGALLGICGAIQIWAALPALVILVWIAWRTRRQPGGWQRPTAAYVAGGLVTIAVLFAPFLVAAGPRMIRIIIFDQLGRGTDHVALIRRLVGMEGLPAATVRVPLAHVGVVVGAVAIAAAAGLAAWRRPIVRLWAGVMAAQAGFLLLVSPSFFRHYAGWYAPVAALCLGSAAAVLGEAVARWRRARVPIVPVAYAAALSVALAITLFPKAVHMKAPTQAFPARAVSLLLRDARCPTSDSPTLLILTGAMRQMLDNGCPLLVSPTGVSYETDRDPGTTRRTRPHQPEYQAAMRAYYTGSDAAAFIRRDFSNGLSADTWAAIRARFPVERDVGRVRIFLPGG